MKSKLRKLLNEKKFVFTAETSPPDSGNKDVVIDEVECSNGLRTATKAFSQSEEFSAITRNNDGNFSRSKWLEKNIQSAME